MAPNLPKTYKAAIFKEANAPLSLEDVELKQPVEGEVLIKVLATGICHSDAFAQAGAFGNPLYATSTIRHTSRRDEATDWMMAAR